LWQVAIEKIFSNKIEKNFDKGDFAERVLAFIF